MNGRARFPVRTRIQPTGFSLIELMVAMLLSLILGGAVLQVYLVNKRTFVSQDQNAQVQEAGRFAVEFMARDLRMAGLLGCASVDQPKKLSERVKNVLNDSSFPYDIEIGIRGFEAPGSAPGKSLTLSAVDPLPEAGGSKWSPALPAPLAGKVLPGSDVVVVSGIEPESWPLVSPFTKGSQIFVATPNAIQGGDILMVTDCNQAMIFQATSVNADSSNVIGAAKKMNPGNSAPIAQGKDGPFVDGSQVSRVRSFAFYLGRGEDGAPSLIRESLQTTSASAATLVREELIGHVETLQITYGIDTNADFVIDNFDTAAKVIDWTQVRAVRLGLLLRSPQAILPEPASGAYAVGGVAVTAPADRRQRRVFPMTVSLRNRLP